MSDLRSPLARARGHGAAHDGTHHFWLQRLTAIALVPLTLWFTYMVVCKTGVSHAQFTSWLQSLPVAAGFVLLLVATFWHAALGLQVVIEDYVSCPFKRTLGIITVKLGCFALATIGVLAVLKISFGA